MENRNIIYIGIVLLIVLCLYQNNKEGFIVLDRAKWVNKQEERALYEECFKTCMWKQGQSTTGTRANYKLCMEQCS